MIHRWPPNDAARGNRYGPDPKAPIRTLAQITITSRGTRISSSYHRPRRRSLRPHIIQERRGRGLRALRPLQRSFTPPWLLQSSGCSRRLSRQSPIRTTRPAAGQASRLPYYTRQIRA